MLVDGVAKIKNGPSSDAADAFLEFLLSEDTQKELSETYYQIPSIAMTEEPTWLADLNLKEMEVDWDRIGANETEWIGYWSENIKGKG
jgi:iron(III) transport system substrate-binding protein